MWEIPLAELNYRMKVIPAILRGSFAHLDSLVTTAHLEIVPCHIDFPITIQTTSTLWVSVAQHVLQIKAPTQIHDKVIAIPTDGVTTLYTASELSAWEDFSSFPAFMKASHQKILNSFCAAESCALGSRTLLSRIFDMNQLVESVEFCVLEILKSLNSL